MTALLLALLAPAAHADEGMWLPEQLPELADELKGLGLELPPEQLADPLGDPLGAIVSLGFCSASFVSPDGLAATNHHCVESYLQYVSDGAANRARDGFTAASRADEVWAGPTARLWVVESLPDGTDRVTGAVKKRASDAARYEAVEKAKKQIVAECEAEPNRRCNVASFHHGLEYRLLKQREIRDVRLVYAPPVSVGSYGGEIDNWMWPRHAGDFAFVRAYVAPDGSSADHADENVPFRPDHHLRIDPTGAQEGEFVMVAGFPGRTARYRLADEFRHEIEQELPAKIALYGGIAEVLERHAAADPEAAARLQAPIAYLGNGTKYYQGILDSLASFDPVAARAEVETALDAWLAADRKRRKTYAPVLAELRETIAAKQAHAERDRLIGALFLAADLLSAGHTAYRLAGQREKPDLERDAGFQDRDVEQIAARFARLDRTLHLPSDRDVLALLLEQTQALPADQRIAPLDAWLAEQGGIEATLERLYDQPALADGEARAKLLELDRAALEASDDPWIALAVRLERGLLAERRERDRAFDGAMLRLRPVLMEALIALQPGRVYPDANGTLRITYGKVQGVSPRDGVLYLPHTTVRGMALKAGAAPFDAPPALVRAAMDAPRSRFADAALHDVPVDFLTTLDTTGGNSGSATLNGKGELVGLIFDGTYESISSDWVFQPAITRSIHVDVRYIGWLLEQDPAAAWILEEIGL